MNVDKACEKMGQFLRWRVENGIDDIRQEIVNGKKNPTMFPNAEYILSKAP